MSSLTWVTTVIPLVAVLALTAAKDAVDDIVSWSTTNTSSPRFLSWLMQFCFVWLSIQLPGLWCFFATFATNATSVLSVFAVHGWAGLILCNVCANVTIVLPVPFTASLVCFSAMFATNATSVLPVCAMHG